MSCKKGRKSKHLSATLVTENRAPCGFCQRNVDDEIMYGKLYAIGDVQCHYFCALLSSCLIQKGKDEEGLFGFLYPDIVAEIERSKKHKCSYCSKKGATLGCCISQCRKQFHLPCGKERNSVSLFYGNYKSYCQLHAPKQEIPDHIMAVAKLRKNRAKDAKTLKAQRNLSNLKELCADNSEFQSEDLESVCVICYEAVDGFPTLQTFWPPCCARDAWFHRTCIQRMALSAGIHYLKCPLCNDKNNFHEAVVSQGYYVPDRDAAWELEQNAFAEIYERPVSCSAQECQCPMGRSHDADNGPWDIKLCLLCGTSGVHAHCMTSAGARRFVCVTCEPHAPTDLDALANSIEAVILEEQARDRESSRRGPVMPSRMSVRRTKHRRHNNNTPSTSRSHLTTQTENTEVEDQAPTNTVSSRLELNLKTPRKQPEKPTASEKLIFIEPKMLKSIENTLLSPIKLLEQRFYEKIQCMDAEEIQVDTSKVLERVRENFKKPMPLCEKRRIVNEILNSLFETKGNFKTKEPVKEWNTPKKCCDITDETFEEPISMCGTPKLIAHANAEPLDHGITNSEITLIGPSTITIIENDTQFSSSNCEEIAIGNLHEESQFHPLNESSSALKTIKPPIIEEAHSISLNIDETVKDKINEEAKIKNDENESSSSTFQLPPEFIADNISEDSLQLFETPKKLSNNQHERSVEGHRTPLYDTSAIKTIEFSSNVDESSQFIPSNVEETANDNIYEETEERQLQSLNESSSARRTSESPSIIEEETQFFSSNIEDTVKDKINEEAKIKNDENESSSSTFQLPPEFIADNISEDSQQLFETPKKLKTVEIQKDSSLEISENDQVVNIDVFKIENNDSVDCNKLKSPKTEILAFKFSPLRSKAESDNDIDLESFKNYYLNEVERDFQCTYSHKHKHSGDKEGLSTFKLKTAIDFAINACHDTKSYEALKRKIESTDMVPKKKKKESICVLKYETDGKDADKNVCSNDECQTVKGIDLAVNTTENGLQKKHKNLKKKKDAKLNVRRSKNKRSNLGKFDMTLNTTEKSLKKRRRKLKKDAEINLICSNNENQNVNQIDLTVNTNEENIKKKSRKIKKNNKSSVRSTIQVKIRLRKEQVRLKITNSRSKKLNKEKKKERKLKNLTQYILTSPESNSKNIICKPENDIPLMKKKCLKLKKSTDNLKQTSIQNFFKVKTE